MALIQTVPIAEPKRRNSFMPYSYCFFFICIAAEVMSNLIYAHSYLPSLIQLIKSDTGSSRCVIFHKIFVLMVNKIGHISNIAPSVVVSYVIYMIDFIIWIRSSHKQECKPMSSIKSSVDSDTYVSCICMNMPSTISRLLVATRVCFNPRKDASIWAVA